MESVILCRYGELFLKAGNRRAFERILADNVRVAMADLPRARVETPHGRLLVHLPADDAEEAAGRLARVFGLVSVSVARQVEAKEDLDAIGATAVEEARNALARDRPASFKIEARRADKRFGKSSLDIARVVGARVQAETGLAVDVHAPALRLGIEVGTDVAHVYATTRDAPGGLPVGASGRALLLLSGGIDSPVAGWLAAKRGLALDAVYFHSPPYIGEKSRDKVLALGKQLARWQALRSVTVVPFTDAQKRLRDEGPAELAVVLYRRMMMRVAERIAKKSGAKALATGEALAQVASQTLENLTVIGAAATLPVLRPCLGHDKLDTIALAQRIGTYETSILPFDDCCSLFVPEHPITKARLEDVLAAESKLDVDALAAGCAANVESIVCANAS